MSSPNVREYSVYWASMDRQFAAGVVRWALQNRSDVSAQSRDTFNEVMSVHVPINGFRGEKVPTAPIEVLVNPVTTAARANGLVANAVFGVWWESHDDLRDIVWDILLRYVEENELDVEQATLTPEEMMIHSQAAASLVLDDHPEIKRDEAQLMVFLVFNQADIHRHEQEVEQTAAEQALVDEALGDEELEVSADGAALFASVLEQLEALSADSPDWDAPLIRLQHRIEELRAKKLLEREIESEIVQRINAMIETHDEIFTYFEWNPDERLPKRSGPWKNLVGLNDALNDVATFILDYESLREPGSTYSEEMERSPKRLQAQNELWAALENLQLMAVAPAPIETNSEDPVGGDQEVIAVQAIGDENTGLRSIVERHRLDAENAKANLVEAQTELVETKKARDQFMHERDSLRAENDELRGKLFEANAHVESLRGAVIGSHENDVADGSTPEFRDVSAVLDHVDGLWPDALRIVLNSSSEPKLIFDRPQQLYTALEWLATTYRSAKIGELSVPDLQASLAETCGWDYVPHQSEVTMGKYRADYETTDNGIKFRLEPHIGRGISGGAAQIRVAFAWDDVRQLVVVGYVGRHQTTDQS